MKIKITLLVSLFTLGLIPASSANSANDGTISVVPPASETGAEKNGPDRKRGKGGLEARLQHLDKNLQLTVEQKQKIKDIWAKQAEALKDLTPEERRSQGRETMKAARDEIRAVLTPEQQTKFDAMAHEDKGLGKGRGKKPGGE